MKNKTESLFKEFYIWEFNQKDRLDSQLSFPATVLTIMFGVLFIVVQNLPTPKWSVISVGFYGLLVCSTIMVAIFVGLLIRSTLGYDYEYLPDSESIRKYFASLENYYNATLSAHDKKNSGFFIENDMSNYLIENCSTAAKRNRANNLKKAKYLHNAKKAMTVSLILLLPTFVMYGLVNLRESKVTKVMIVNRENGGVETNMTNRSTNSTGNNTSETQKQLPIQPENKVKPEPPKNVLLKGGVEKSETTKPSE